MAHLVPDRVAQDSRVVDDGVDPAKLRDGILDDACRAPRIGNAGEIGVGAASGGADVGHGRIGGPCIAAVATLRHTGVIDDHRSALARAQQRDFAPDPAACAGNGDDFSFQYARHAILIPCLVAQAVTGMFARFNNWNCISYI